MAIVYIFTGKLDIAFSVGVLELVSKMGIYFFHERLWNRIRFGRREISPIVVWFTGLSKSGKTSVAAEVHRKLCQAGFKSEHLDGRTIRHLFPETGFTRRDVDEHIKRVGYLASKLEQQGVFVVASFVSPYIDSRSFVRELCHNFIEVHVATPIEICAARDEDDFYRRARSGEFAHVPGVDTPYEVPVAPEIKLDTSSLTIQEAADIVFRHLQNVLNKEGRKKSR